MKSADPANSAPVKARIKHTATVAAQFLAVYSFAALTPLTGFLVQSPPALRRLLKQVSNYWLGWMLYLLLAVLAVEALLACLRRIQRRDFAQMQRVRQVQGGAALALVCAVCLYGMANALSLIHI